MYRRRGVELAHPVRTQPAIQRDLRMAKQGLAEPPALHEVHILFFVDQVAAHKSQDFPHGRRLRKVLHLEKIRFPQILQAVCGSLLHELIEVHGRIGLRQFIVIDALRMTAQNALQFLTEKGAVPILVRLRRREECEQRPCLIDLLLRLRETPRVIAQHLADDGAEVSARVGAVADVGDPLGLEVRPANAQQLILHGARHPGIYAVRDDVVEHAQFGRDIHDVEMPQRDISQCQLLRQRLSIGDTARACIQAHELAAGQPVRHGYEIAAVAAPQLQYAAGFHGSRIHCEQSSHRGESVGVSLGKRVAGIQDFVVRVDGRGGHDQSSLLASERYRGTAIYSEPFPASPPAARPCPETLWRRARRSRPERH